ncbi:MAG TPA: hypothetical protein VKV17_10780 [Bryobacteraceae bacterium]|nr:hypothetical protein [Bryobacteraceae bacterium]
MALYGRPDDFRRFVNDAHRAGLGVLLDVVYNHLGFGRTIRVLKGYGSTTVSEVDTQYAPCGCSPLGKVSAVSEPYAPGGTPVWTTYTYDGSGRMLTSTAPDGSVTQYSYQGNNTTVTDPAGNGRPTRRTPTATWSPSPNPLSGSGVSK